MPIYEYHCKCCDKNFELLVRSSTKPACPACGNKNISKKMSAFAVGSGNQSDAAELCGTCGEVPGSCAF
ncbi:MAG: FmdB family zinc ribbon protein [Gammaproteobacteria bacterium]